MQQKEVEKDGWYKTLIGLIIVLILGSYTFTAGLWYKVSASEEPIKVGTLETKVDDLKDNLNEIKQNIRSDLAEVKQNQKDMSTELHNIVRQQDVLIKDYQKRNPPRNFD
jgi:apolipoprotein N-acyltransferase